MTKDELREALAEALLTEYRAIWGQHRGWNLTDRFADAVLPVVTAYAAEIADDIEWAATKQADPVIAEGYMCAAGRIREALEDDPA